MRGFVRAPVRRQRRKFADDQRFDIWLRGLLVVIVRPDVSDVRIGEADDLPCVAWVGENFLIAGEAGVENNFAATAGASTRGAPLKYFSVLERERRASCEGLDQCVLQRMSFRCGVDR